MISKIKNDKESKGQVFNFVSFKTPWASKIIEKQLDEAKTGSPMYRAILAAWLLVKMLNGLEFKINALAAVLRMLGRSRTSVSAP